MSICIVFVLRSSVLVLLSFPFLFFFSSLSSSFLRARLERRCQTGSSNRTMVDIFHRLLERAQLCFFLVGGHNTPIHSLAMIIGILKRSTSVFSGWMMDDCCAV